MTTHEHAHPAGYRQYFMTWFWLLLMTTAALLIGYVNFLPGGLKAVVLVTITLAKIFLIGSIFMHLRTEKVNLVMLTFSPLLLAMVLFFFTFGELFQDIPTHQIQNQSPTYATTTGGGGEAKEHK